jgi:CHAT domain-containing protein
MKLRYPLLLRAVVIALACLAALHPLAAQLPDAYAAADAQAQRRGKVEAAIKTRVQELAKAEQKGLPDSVRVALRTSLMRLYGMVQRQADAAEAYQAALKDLQRLGPSWRTRALALQAEYAVIETRYADALQLLGQLQALQTTPLAQAATLDKQAAVALLSGDYLAADRFAQTALQQLQPALPAALPLPKNQKEADYQLAYELWTSATRHRVCAWVGQGRFAQATAMLDKLFATKNDTLPFLSRRTPAFADMRYARAQAYHFTEQHAQASAAYKQAVAAARTAYGSTSTPYLQRLLAATSHALAQGTDAQRAYKKTDAALHYARLGMPKAKGTLGALQLMEAGAFYHAQGYREKARSILQRAITALQPDSAARNRSTLHTARAYYLYAEADLADGRETNASLYNHEAMAAQQRNAGKGNMGYATLLGLHGRIKAAQYQFPKSETLFTEAIAISSNQRQALHPEHIALLTSYADLLALQNKFEAAAAQMQAVQKLDETLYGKGSIQFVRVTAALGKLYLNAGNYPQATAQLDDALATLRSLPKRYVNDETGILETLAELWLARGDFKRSEDFYLEALRLKKRDAAGEAVFAAGTTTKLAELYQTQGRYSDAHKLLAAVVAMYQKTGRTNDEYTAALSSLALLNLKMGQYREAEQNALRARTITKNLWKEQSLNYANAQVLLARIVTEMGRYKQAQGYLEQAYALFKNYYGESNINTAKLLSQLALNYYYQGQNEPALRTLNTALRNTEAAVGTEHIEYAGMQRTLAQLYISMGLYAKADTLLGRVQLVQQKLLGLKHPDFLRTEYTLAELYKLMKDYKGSNAVFVRTLAAWKKVLGTRHPDYAFILADHADLQYLANQPTRARKTYEAALKLLLAQVKQYFPALSEQEKSDYWNKINAKLERYYVFAIAQAARQPQLTAQAYNLRLQTKALLLAQTTALRARILNSKDEDLKALFERWQSRREYLSKLYTLSKAEMKTANVKLETVEDEVNQLEKELSLKSEFFAGRRNRPNPDWKDIREKLAPGAAAIEIIRARVGKTAAGSDSIVYAALIVDKGQGRVPAEFPRMVTLTNGARMERRYYPNYSRSISNRFADTLSYKYFWAPLEAALAGINTVYLSTDGVYNQISLPALRDATGKYVLDKIDLRYLSNTKDLLKEDPQNFFEGRTALLVGNPRYNPKSNSTIFEIPELEGTQQEIDKVGKLLNTAGWQTQELTLEDASESNIKARGNPKLLHIATHGFFYPTASGQEEASILGMEGSKAAQNPLLRSGLFLTGAAMGLAQEEGDTLAAPEPADAAKPPASEALDDGKPRDNGIMTAYEVMNMTLDNTQLVVLSACETGLGEIKNGEGVYGLQRAFAIAGARSVIMSLWRVNDAVTQQMIAQFYQNWALNKMDVYKAFKAAQQAVRQQFEEPYYWGAFIMTGQ